MGEIGISQPIFQIEGSGIIVLKVTFTDSINTKSIQYCSAKYGINSRS